MPYAGQYGLCHPSSGICLAACGAAVHGAEKFIDG